MHPDRKIIDLTHDLSADTPTWEADCGFELLLETDYHYSLEPDRFRVQRITSRAGIGTHIDAPAHCFPNTPCVDEIELQSLISSCVVIKASCESDEGYVFTPKDIEDFESKHGTIPSSSFALFFSGWSKHWGHRERYRNDLRFPSVHHETAKLLLERNISGLGIDTLSPDCGGRSFPVHREILGAGKYLVENVANAESLPPTGATVLILPMKIEGGTEAPVRMVALL
ncbi:MAG: cyclase family protein [Bdellovibrionota bacterium]